MRNSWYKKVTYSFVNVIRGSREEGKRRRLHKYDSVGKDLQISNLFIRNDLDVSEKCFQNNGEIRMKKKT